jgi:hypothetical protein
VIEAQSDPLFAFEPTVEGRVALERQMRHLDYDLSTVRLILRPINGPHTAAGHHSQNLKAIEHVAGFYVVAGVHVLAQRST